jgi:hypothetical protein
LKFLLGETRPRPAFAAAALALVLPVAVAVAAHAAPNLRPIVAAPNAVTYKFTTLDNPADPTFNQLLGINDAGVIAGYYGSGATGHPNQGYTLLPQYSERLFKSEDYPGSVQTQVTALNNYYDTAGFWVDGSGNNYGFVRWHGLFTSYTEPNQTGTVTQILGLNSAGEAVGFYTDSAGTNHGFRLRQRTQQYSDIAPPGGTNVTASGINNLGNVTGFMTSKNGPVIGYLLDRGRLFRFSFPGATATTPFGINDNDEIAGSYLDKAGASHGFTLIDPTGAATFASIDDPKGVGTTVVNGINDKAHLVGFYVDAAGNTHGFLARWQI